MLERHKLTNKNTIKKPHEGFTHLLKSPSPVNSHTSLSEYKKLPTHTSLSNKVKKEGVYGGL